MAAHLHDPKTSVEMIDNVAAFDAEKDFSVVGFIEGTDEEKELTPHVRYQLL